MLASPVLLRRPLRVQISAILALAGTAAALSGCGEPEAKVPPALTRAAVDAALATTPTGSTSAQRAVDAAAGTLMPGDGDKAKQQLEKQLAALGDTPVVVNLWGDWCAPCKKELPIFQRATLQLRGKVAFLGIATRTTRGKTESYLAEEIALPYPSIFDPDEQINGGTGVSSIPKTLFYSGARKRQPFVHIGPYESVAKLLEDVDRYAS